MTSKLVVNTIEADTGISSVSFASSISMDSTSKFHFSAAGVDIGADTNINRPAAGVLGFNISGAEKLRIDTNGHLNTSGIVTAANFKSGVTNVHNLGVTLTGGQLDVGSNIKIGTAGVVTATSFSGSGANLTNLPAANLTGTLPAISGANLTGISVDNISEGNTKAEVVDTGAGHFKVETDGAERFRVNDNGKLTTGGETSPDVITGGLCLNTGNADGIFFSCKNSDIAHGRTSLDETDTLFSMRKISGDKGGVDLRGYTDSAGGDPAIRIFGTIDDSSDAGYCPVELRGARKNTGGNTGTSGIPVDRGVVRISNDGDNTVATFTGEGLCFHSDTAAANALDEYEEGTFTPRFQTSNGNWGGSMSSQNGSYTRIGNFVHVRFRIHWGSVSGSGTFRITALPFTVANTASNEGGGATIGWRSGFNYPRLTSFFRLNTQLLQFGYIDASGSYGSFDLSVGAIASTGYAYISGSYEVA